MKFLVDAQLPKRLANWLCKAGHNAIHTLDLPQGNRTPDSEVCRLADAQDRIVVTKDDDFVYAFLVQGSPRYLLLVNSGNIANTDLLALFQQWLPTLLQTFAEYRFVELTREAILNHE